MYERVEARRSVDPRRKTSQSSTAKGGEGGTGAEWMSETRALRGRGGMERTIRRPRAPPPLTMSKKTVGLVLLPFLKLPNLAVLALSCHPRIPTYTQKGIKTDWSTPLFLLPCLESLKKRTRGVRWLAKSGLASVASVASWF